MESNAANIKSSSRPSVKLESTPNQDVAGGSGVYRARPALATITNRVTDAPRPLLGRKRMPTVMVVSELINKPKPVPKKRITTKDMIIEAIKALQDDAGSTVAAIKGFVLQNYDVDEVRSKFMDRVLRTAHQEGWLIQTSDTGSCTDRRFRLPDGMKKNTSGKSFEPTPGPSNDNKGVAGTDAPKGSILVREDSGETVNENKKKKKVTWDKREQVLHFDPANDSRENQ